MRAFRIVFMGTPDFAVPSLQRLHQKGFDIAAVVTGPDKKRGRGNDLTPTPIKKAALELELPVIETDNLRAETLADQLRELCPDLIVVVAFRILPPTVLAIPTIGSVNLHASLLPKFRGAAPIHHAVMNGEQQTGATVFFLDDKVDTGACLSQIQTAIGPDETTGEVYNRLMKIGADLLADTLEEIRYGRHQALPQDNSRASLAPKLFQKDCEVLFDRPASVVHNHIRGLSPHPCGFTCLDGKRLKLLRSSIGPSLLGQPSGEVVSLDDTFLVSCANGESVILHEVQLEGKKSTDGPSFLRGYFGAKKLCLTS
jgi:methionyl-tRNA formyltransferase